MTPIDLTACREFCERRENAKLISCLQPIPLDRPAPVLRYQPEAEAPDTRPPALSRGPCVRCGTRGEIGCAHQRAYEAEGLVEFTRYSSRWDYRRCVRDDEP